MGGQKRLVLRDLRRRPRRAFDHVSGLSLTYNVGLTIFGGFAPFFAQSLIDLTGSKLAQSLYITVTAFLSLVSLLILRLCNRSL